MTAAADVGARVRRRASRLGLLGAACVLLLLGQACVYDYDALKGRDGGASSGTGGAIGTGGTIGIGVGGSGGSASGSGGRAAGSGGQSAGTGGAATGSGGGTGGAGVGSGGQGTGSGGTGSGGSATGTGGSTSGTGGVSTGSGGAATGGSSAGGSTGTGGTSVGDPDLVLHYTFDEGSGTTAADSSGFEGGPRNATLGQGGTGGSVAFSTTHQVGTHAVAMTANGSNGGGYLSVPSLNELAPGAVTVAAWVNLTTMVRWQRVFDYGHDTTRYLFLTTSDSSSNYVRFAITTNGNPSEERIMTTTALTTGAWHHLAVVLPAGSPYTGTLYIDGAVAGTNAAMTLHPGDIEATPNNYIGRSEFTADPYLNGLVDDYRVYRRALDAAEIAALFAAR